MSTENPIEPNLFPVSGNLAENINNNIVESEIEGGVYVKNLKPGDELEVETESRKYKLHYIGGDEFLISGHPVYCPEPTPVTIHGSTWGGSMLKNGFIGRGMQLEFGHPSYPLITTSQIVEIKQLSQH